MTLIPLLRNFHHLVHDDVIICSVCTLDGKFTTKDRVFETKEQLFEYYTKWNKKQDFFMYVR